MNNNKELRGKLNIEFNKEEFADIDFGKLEGERDPLLESSFFPTYTVEKYLKSPYNYVLSPKGAGKSALFRVLQRKYVDKSYFNFKKYSIISINDAFGFNDDYLNVDKFREDSRMKLTISWGIFILTKLIEDIKENYSDKPGYKEFANKIIQIAEFKDRFNLYDLSDLIETISTSIAFVANGQKYEVTPKIKLNKKGNKIVLNNLFRDINDFYKSINKTALILIDRIDNFVQKEEFSLQRKYIQGLFDCIEEISLYENIIPTLFLRTDLFHSYESDIEYDKIKDRIIELKWTKGETLNFIVYRLDANKYFYNNYRPFLEHFIKEANKGKHRKANKGKHRNFKKRKISLGKRIINLFKSNTYKTSALDTNKAFNYAVSEDYLNIFFPKSLYFNDENINFIDWIFKYLKDANDFVNPRLLIYFFNQLFEGEISYSNQYYPDETKKIKPSIVNNSIDYKLFHNDTFKLTYEKIQNDELKSIYILIKKKDHQIVFKEINSRFYNKNTFKYGDINTKSLKVTKW